MIERLPEERHEPGEYTPPPTLEDVAYKVNELVDAVNELEVCKVDKKPAPYLETPPERTITTPPEKETSVHKYSQGGKEEFSVCGDLEAAKKEFIADYKKLLVEKVQNLENTEELVEPDYFYAIEVVKGVIEETD